MARKKDNRWDDIDGGMAFIIPYTLLRHPNYRRLSPYGHKLIADLACQYTGMNNGFLCASYTLMSEQGWKSEHTLRKAQAELEHYGIVERTRQGGRNRATLLAFSFRRIDSKRGGPALDIGPTGKPSDLWKQEKPEFAFKPKKRKPPKKPQLRSVA